MVPRGQSAAAVSGHRPTVVPQFRNMASLRVRRLLRPGRRWFSETVPGAPSPPASPLYPPVVASITAKSKAAKSRRLQRFNQRVHAAATVEEKLRLYGKLQRPKYTVYPQTFALNADRWYRSFTRTVLVPGMPPRAAAAKPPVVSAGATPEAGGAPGPGVKAPAAEEAPGTAETPGAAKTQEPAAGAAPQIDIGELRSLACDALLQESFYQNKKRPFLYRDQDHTPGPFLTQLVSTLAASLSGRNPLLAASSLGREQGWEGKGRGSIRASVSAGTSGVSRLLRPSLVVCLHPSAWILGFVSHCSYRGIGRFLKARCESLFFCVVLFQI